jgi:REP element-mobilizing transposase RayT
MSQKPPPLQYGKTYHLYGRGINRENIFFQERNFRYFLQQYTQHLFGYFNTYAYCLLWNHYHFLVQVKCEEEIIKTPGVLAKPQGSPTTTSPSQKFGNFLNAYAKSINHMYDRTGSLFQHRFGRIEVTSEIHCIHLIAYIHRNPQKHGFVEDFRDWPYCSYHAYLSQKNSRLKREGVLEWFGKENQAVARMHFVEFHDTEIDETRIAPLIADDFD